jgi:hypothetical protein
MALFDDEIALVSGAKTRTSTQQHKERKIYDTRRNRNLLERPTQLEVTRLLLQGRSSSHSAAAFQVDGLDGEFRAPERYPDHFAFDRIIGCCIAHRDRQRNGEWHRVYYWSRFHHRFMLGVRLFVFAHRMRAMTPRSPVPPLARSVPLSRFTSPVGGGSAFYDDHPI